jgi:hypothetical protein
MTYRIPLTQGFYAIVDTEDAEWLSQWNWCVAKTASNTYAKRTLRGILMHREVLRHHGIDAHLVDHANHNGLDNRKSNLRPCSSSENNANRRKSGGSSRFKGVHFEKQTKMWRPEISFEGRRIRGPRLLTEVEAAAWYDRKALALFGDFAVLNGVKP